MKFKKILFLIPIIAALAFAGCMTTQVELRLEYDKLVKAITAVDGRKEDFVPESAGEGAKAVLEYIWITTNNTKAMIENFQGMEQEQIAAVNPMFMLMSSVQKNGKSQSTAEFPYYIKDIKISLITFGFKAEYNNRISAYQADAHFMLSVTGTAIDKDGNVLKDGKKNDITYTSTVILLNMNPAVPAPEINLHRYKISEDANEIPVYNLVFFYYGNLPYSKSKNEWKISSVEDGNPDTVLSLDEIANMLKGGAE